MFEVCLPIMLHNPISLTYETPFLVLPAAAQARLYVSCSGHANAGSVPLSCSQEELQIRQARACLHGQRHKCWRKKRAAELSVHQIQWKSVLCCQHEYQQLPVRCTVVLLLLRPPYGESVRAE